MFPVPATQTLQVDTGTEMQGGQWQVLYLIERLIAPTLVAPPGSPLFMEARKRDIEARPVTGRWMESNATLIHAHDSWAHSLGIWDKIRRPLDFRLSRLPLIVSRRVGFPPGRSIFSRLKYRFADRYLAVSKYVAMQLREAGVPDSKIRVVYDGVPIPPKPAKPKPNRVVAVSSKYRELPGIPVRLAKNLFDDLQSASVFLYVSDMEGLGSAAIAAMASGVPVVASAVGGLAEVVDQERTGLLVTDGNYASAVKRLLDNPNMAADFGAAGREKARREFSVEKMVQGTLDAYNEILR
jgi:hypothetical protein